MSPPPAGPDRRPVSVVVPFAGDPEAAQAALTMLRGLRTIPGDELILADNSGTAPADAAGVRVIRAAGEHSPAHARNVGAAHAGNDWILFLDADTLAPADLIDRYFVSAIAPDVAILAGQILPAPGARTLAQRYAASRNFLDQRAHLAHPYRPRAAAANMLVRRRAFEIVGGFRERLRAAEDTDLCWRLAPLAWRLELREEAAVQHEYRASIGALRRQWRAYAAGRAWLARQYPGFHPEPAVTRGLQRAVDRIGARGRGGPATGLRASGRGKPAAEGGRCQRAAEGRRRQRAAQGGRRQRAAFLFIDAVLAVEELIGLRLSNEPPRALRDTARGVCARRRRERR